MRIGFISICGERGQWHVTKNFMRALQDEHELFLLARPFGVRDGVFIGNVDNYSLKVRSTYSPTYNLDPTTVKEWIRTNSLDVVFYNEELNWSLVEAAKEENVKVVTYLDYFSNKDIERFRKYDLIIACAEHAYNVFIEKEFKNIVFLNWGVDTELFKPTPELKKRTFFHSAGWGGVNWRKCSPEILIAFDEIRAEGHDLTMSFHSQTAKHHYPLKAQEALEKRLEDGSLEVVWGSVSHPGLYHTGHINVAPSRLEGLGLFLYEGMSCGMPTITTNAPPMNQSIVDKKNGLLIKVLGQHFRTDPYYFPEYNIDAFSLKRAMIELGTSKDLCTSMSITAREIALQKHSYTSFASNVQRLFKNI